MRQKFLSGFLLVLMIVILVAATQTNEVGGTKMKGFTVANGADSTWHKRDFQTWAQITGVMIISSSTADAITVNQRNGAYQSMPYPPSTNEIWPLQFRAFSQLDSSSNADSIFAYHNNGVQIAYVYFFGS